MENVKKTKKKKLTAAIHRQKEFERIKLSFALSKLQKSQNTEEVLRQVAEFPKLTPKVTKQDEILTNLTNLSYLPKQLLKILVVTFALILVQVLLALTLL